MKSIFRLRQLAIENKACQVSARFVSRGYAAAAEGPEASAGASDNAGTGASVSSGLSNSNEPSGKTAGPASPTGPDHKGSDFTRPAETSSFSRPRPDARGTARSGPHRPRERQSDSFGLKPTQSFEESTISELESLLSKRNKKLSQRIWGLYNSLPPATRQSLKPATLQAVLRQVVPEQQFVPKETRWQVNPELSSSLDNRFRKIVSDMNATHTVAPAFDRFDDYAFAMQNLGRMGDARTVDAIAKEVMVELGIGGVEPATDPEDAVQMVPQSLSGNEDASAEDSAAAGSGSEAAAGAGAGAWAGAGGGGAIWPGSEKAAKVLLYRLLAMYSELRLAAPPQQRGNVKGQMRRQAGLAPARQREIVVVLLNIIRALDGGIGVSTRTALLFTGCLNLARKQFDQAEYGDMLTDIVEQTITKVYGIDTRYFTVAERPNPNPGQTETENQDQDQDTGGYVPIGMQALHLVLDWLGTRGEKYKMISAFEILGLTPIQTLRRDRAKVLGTGKDKDFTTGGQEGGDAEGGQLAARGGDASVLTSTGHTPPNFFQSKTIDGHQYGLSAQRATATRPSTATARRRPLRKTAGIFPWSGRWSKALNTDLPLDNKIFTHKQSGFGDSHPSVEPNLEPRMSFFNTYDPLRRMRRFGAYLPAPWTPEFAAAKVAASLDARKRRGADERRRMGRLVSGFRAELGLEEGSQRRRAPRPPVLANELTYYIMLRYTVDWRDPALALHVFRCWWLAAAEEQSRWVRDILRAARIANEANAANVANAANDTNDVNVANDTNVANAANDTNDANVANDTNDASSSNDTNDINPGPSSDSDSHVPTQPLAQAEAQTHIDPQDPPAADAYGEVPVPEWIRQTPRPRVYFSPGMFAMLHWMFRDFASDNSFKGGEFRVVHDLIRDALERMRQEYVILFGREPPPMRHVQAATNGEAGAEDVVPARDDGAREPATAATGRVGAGGETQTRSAPFAAFTAAADAIANAALAKADLADDELAKPAVSHGFHTGRNFDPSRYLLTLEQSIGNLDNLLVTSMDQWRMRNERRKRARSSRREREARRAAKGETAEAAAAASAPLPRSAGLGYRMEKEARERSQEGEVWGRRR